MQQFSSLNKFKMKKIITLLLASSLLLTACGSASTNNGFDTGEYKNVTVTATLTMTNDEAQAATCLGSSEFLIDFWFPLDGKMDIPTPEIASKAYMHLTNYYCTNCSSAVLPDSDYEPHEVTATGNLLKTNTGWEIQNLTIDMPPMKTLSLSPVLTCGGLPGLAPDPALMVQFFTPFMIDATLPLEFGDNEIATHSYAYPMPMGEMLMDFTMTMTNTSELPN
jgi:uncharacterized protein YceK